MFTLLMLSICALLQPAMAQGSNTSSDGQFRREVYARLLTDAPKTSYVAEHPYMQTPRASGIQISSSVRFIKTNLQSIAVSTTTRRAWSISMSGFVVGSVDVTYPFQFGASKASGNLSGSDIEDVSTVINSSLFTCGIGIYTAGTTAYLDSLSTSDSRGFSVN